LKPGLFRSADYDEKHVKLKIEPYVLRRRAKGLPGLPEVQYDKTYLDLLPKQREAYDRAEKDGIIHLKELGNDVSVQHIFQLITALKMICNIEDQSGESSKLDYLHDILEEIVEQGDKALVFSQYSAGSLRKIRPRLEKFSPQLFDGSLSLAERDRVVREFQNLEESKVLLMTFGAGGVGLTLTRANYVFHFDHWWNPAVMDQAAGRAARLGQEKTVFVKSLIIRNSIEERIQAILEKKKSTFDRTINDLTDEDIQARLTEEDLLGLFGLSKKPAIPTQQKSVFVDISPEGFEKLVRGLYERMGYDAKLTNTTGDHGIDVVARKAKADGSMEKIVIQCKHYPDGTVGEPVARDLWGAINSDNLISQGLIITSGEFSRQCREFVADKRIMLIDRKRLEILLAQYDIQS
jgi:hypothetical protein